jgi:hypothetical protein
MSCFCLGIILGTLVILGVSIFIIVYYVRKNRALRYQIQQKKLFNLGVEREGDEEIGVNLTVDLCVLFKLYLLIRCRNIVVIVLEDEEISVNLVVDLCVLYKLYLFDKI